MSKNRKDEREKPQEEYHVGVGAAPRSAWAPTRLEYYMIRCAQTYLASGMSKSAVPAMALDIAKQLIAKVDEENA